MDSHTAPNDESPWLMFKDPIYRLLLSLRPVSSISQWYIIVQDPRDQRSLLVFAFEAMPYSDEENEMSTLLICYGAVVISAFYDGQEYVPPRTPTLSFSGLEGIEAPNIETVLNLRQLAVEVVNECLKKMPVCQEVVHPEAPEVVHPEAPEAAPLHRVPSCMSFVDEMPDIPEYISSTELSSTEISSLQPPRKKQKGLAKGLAKARIPLSAKHGVMLLKNARYFVVKAITDHLKIEPQVIENEKDTRNNHQAFVKKWLSKYLGLSTDTKAGTGMTEFVKNATVNNLLTTAEEMVTPPIKVTAIGSLHQVCPVVIGANGSVSPSDYSNKYISDHPHDTTFQTSLVKFQADMEYLIHVFMAIYARSVGEAMKSENRSNLLPGEIEAAGRFLHTVTTGASKFASNSCSRPARTATKGGFVVEAGELVYKTRPGSLADGPFTADMGLMGRSWPWYCWKIIITFMYFEGHPRGWDGLKNISSRMATMRQKETELLGSPHKGDDFFVETSLIERFIKATDDNKRTATHDWKLYGKFFWTTVLKACAETRKSTFKLFSK